jgi:hypothetical protein
MRDWKDRKDRKDRSTKNPHRSYSDAAVVLPPRSRSQYATLQLPHLKVQAFSDIARLLKDARGQKPCTPHDKHSTLMASWFAPNSGDHAKSACYVDIYLTSSHSDGSKLHLAPPNTFLGFYLCEPHTYAQGSPIVRPR